MYLLTFYTVTLKGCDFREDCMEFPLSFFLCAWFPVFVNYKLVSPFAKYVKIPFKDYIEGGFILIYGLNKYSKKKVFYL